MGAFAESAAPTEMFCPLLPPPLPPVGRASKSVDTDAAPGAATLDMAGSPVPAVLVVPTTLVKDETFVFTSVTAAAPVPPETYTAAMPFAAAAGDVGHFTEMVGCEKPLLPTSIVAVLSAASHLTMAKSRKGTVTLNANVPRARDTVSPVGPVTWMLTTRESSGRPGSKSDAVVGRGDPSVKVSLTALAALLPPTAARTASTAVAPRKRAARRRTVDDASACAAAKFAASCRSLSDGGAGYVVTAVDDSLNGETPHCVKPTLAPGAATASAAATADVVVIDGGGGRPTSAGRFASRELHGFRAGDTEKESGVLPSSFTAVLVTPAPQYAPPGADAASGAVDTLCDCPDADDESSAAVS